MAKRRVHRPEGTPTVTRGRPTPRDPARAGAGKASTSAQKSSLRDRFEYASAPWLVRMGALPRIFIPAVLALALFLGLALPSRWAGLLLLPIALFLGWLSALSWPVLSVGSRVLRLAIALGMGALAISKLAGRL